MNPARKNRTGRGLARSSYSVSADLRKTKAELARGKARAESAEAALREIIEAWETAPRLIDRFHDTPLSVRIEHADAVLIDAALQQYRPQND